MLVVWQTDCMMTFLSNASLVFPVFTQGLALSLGLIVAIGAQNAFVLRQGLRREHVATVVLFCIGVLAGYFLVPLNSLLQHRGHTLLGAGHSIAVQNFNEQACILGLGAFYSLSLKLGLSVFGAITAFGLVVAGTMWLIRRWHISNCHRHREEVEHLLHIARQDHHH